MAKGRIEEDETEVERSPGLAMLYGPVDDETVKALTAWVIGEALEDNPPDYLTLLINSPGGDLAAAFALIEIMQGSAIPIRTIGLGQIASAGLLIFMSGEKGQRILTPTCSIMSHSFSTGLSGNYHDLMAVDRELQFTQRRIVNQYMQCTGKDEAYVVEKLLPHRDVYMSPEEAIEHGFGDVIRGIGKGVA